jgi:uncharacterized protein with PIN domain
MIVGTACPNPSGTDSLGQRCVMNPELPICPDCSGTLKPGLAIARFIERPDIRVLVCEQCHHVHWFAVEGGALRKL